MGTVNEKAWMEDQDRLVIEMTKRKSPIRHMVRCHKRKGRYVRSYLRGKGTPPRKRGKVVRGPRIKKVERFSFDKKHITLGEERRMRERFANPIPDILYYHQSIPTDKIYHLTNNLDDILKTNSLKPGKTGALSLTASDRVSCIQPFRYKKYRIALDFKKLLKDYPNLVPVYYTYSDDISSEISEFYREKGINLKNPKHFNNAIAYVGNFAHECEWVLFKPIKNLSRYIVGIEKKIS